MLGELNSARFWFDLLQIIGINILLSGDNAVVIALASRSLPESQRKMAVLGGSGAAVVLRIAPHMFERAAISSFDSSSMISLTPM